MTMPRISRPGRVRRVRKRGVVGVLLALAVAGTAGCSGSSSTSQGSRVNNSQPTMTPAQAATYAEKILQDTGQALTPRPRLQTSVAGYPYDQLNNTSGCTDPDAPEMVVVSRGYWLRGITVHDYAAIGEQVLAYWKSLHWVITGSRGIGTTQPVIFAVAPPYAFYVSLTWGTATHPGGQLQIGASSVCLPPPGAPSPGQ